MSKKLILALCSAIFSSAAFCRPVSCGPDPFPPFEMSKPDTALWKSIEAGDEAGVQRALALKANPDSTNEGYGTALERAIEKGNLAVVRRLVKGGATIASDDWNWESPTFQAGYYGQLEILRYLRGELRARKLWKNDEDALVGAAGANHVAIVEYLIREGAPVNGDPKSAGRAPLTWAAARGSVDSVKLLLAGGADPDSKGHEGLPLYEAAGLGTPEGTEIMRLLLQAGARPDGVDKSPIQRAAAAGNAAGVQLLLDHKAKPDGYYSQFPDEEVKISALRFGILRGGERRDNYQTVLFAPGISDEDREKYRVMSQTFDVSVVEVLLKGGAKVTEGRNTLALMEAATAGGVDVARLLLEHGADVNGTDKVLDYPIPSSVENRIKFSEGKDPEKGVYWRRLEFERIGHASGLSPLLAAAQSGNPEMVDFLLSQGANAKAADKFGATALTLLGNGGRELFVWELGRIRDVVHNSEFPKQLLETTAAMSETEAKLWSDWGRAEDCATATALLKAGTPVDAADLDGNTPLISAACISDPAVTKILLDAGADVNHQNSFGQSAIIRVLTQGRRAHLQEWLLYSGEDDGYRARFKRRAIQGDVETIRLLMASGARTDIKDRKGRVALQIAELIRYPEAAAVLKGTLVTSTNGIQAAK